jgi:hypothetical protein
MRGAIVGSRLDRRKHVIASTVMSSRNDGARKQPEALDAESRDAGGEVTANMANALDAGLVAARLIGVRDRTARVVVGGAEIDAEIDPSVDTRILSTALARAERVIVVREAAREGHAWVVLGTLRTSPTIGVDEGDFVIRAGRLKFVVDHAFDVASGAASLAIRASGHVETIAVEITSRASSVQRLVARMLRLN